MSPQQLTTVIVRLFAIGLVIYAFQTYYFSLEDSDGIFTRLAIGYFGISLVISAVLWRFPLLVAGKAFSAKDQSEPEIGWNYNQLYSFGFVIVGLGWLVLALSDLIFWFTYALYAHQKGGNYLPIELVADDKAAIVSTLFELVIALTLMFGSKGWLRLISYIRFGKAMNV